MIEELVQLLIGVIDAKLLKRVRLEVLEAEDVENADECGAVFAGIGAFVDVVHQPCKCS